MEHTDLLSHLRRLRSKIRADSSLYGTHSEIRDFISSYVGPKSAYYDAVTRADPRGLSEEFAARVIGQNLDALIASIEAGAHAGVSPRRQAELDVVSDFLGMAHELLEARGVHPAAPAVLIGATLEEFLRTWVESVGLSLGSRKPGLEAYSQVLRDADLITKQDGKDITAWAGVRNHAAHGEWDEVADKRRIALMLEGVNLFLRKYSG
jgi:hypothetical protein